MNTPIYIRFSDLVTCWEDRTSTERFGQRVVNRLFPKDHAYPEIFHETNDGLVWQHILETCEIDYDQVF